MQSTGRDRSPHAPAKRATYAVPPPPPPIRRAANPESPKAALQKSVGNAAHASPETADPKWLEDAVLRIIEKHAERSLTFDLTPPREVARSRRRSSRMGRFAQALLIVAILAGAAAYVLHTRFPVQAAVISTAAKGMIARIPPPRSWFAARPAQAPTPPAPIVQAPVAQAQSSSAQASSAQAPKPPVPSAPTAPSGPIPSATTASIDVSSLPLASAPSAPKAEPKIDKSEPKTESNHAARATHTPRRAPVTAQAAPVTPAAPAPVALAHDAPPPIPGALGEAIKRASGGSAAPTVTARSAAQDSTPATDALPERPAAPVVKSALYAALPDARACMSADAEAVQAVVVFESSGSVSSVQVSGPAAACIQKAFRGARVPPFSQSTYRAGVPVRPN
jgi:hypothetical protein